MKRVLQIVVTVVAAAIGVFVGRMAMDGGFDFLGRQTFTAETLEKSLADQPHQIFDRLKADFPDDYNQLLAGIVETVKQNGDNASVKLAAQQGMAKISRRYADAMAQASEDTIRHLVQEEADLHQRVFDTEGAAACTDFANRGPSALMTGATAITYLATVDQLTADFVDAAAEGRRMPVSFGTPTNDDYSKLAQKMLDSGTPQHYLDVLGETNTADPDACPALIAMMRGMLAMDDVAGARLRADTVHTIAGSSPVA